jgi:hypothetical protein
MIKRPTISEKKLGLRKNLYLGNKTAVIEIDVDRFRKKIIAQKPIATKDFCSSVLKFLNASRIARSPRLSQP